jgi:hypothetical protein
MSLPQLFLVSIQFTDGSVAERPGVYWTSTVKAIGDLLAESDKDDSHIEHVTIRPDFISNIPGVTVYANVSSSTTLPDSSHLVNPGAC